MPTLVVLGMHRSGTSLVSQALSACGISAGPTKDLLSAQADNPEGFYENRYLVEINDSLLNNAGGSWFSPPARVELVVESETVAESVAETETVSQPMSKLLSSLSDQTDAQFFLKDPRLCLTLPCWTPLLGDTSIVFVYRSPLAVARSLARRNQFPLQLGILLWEIYNRRVLATISQQAFSAVSYDRLLAGEESLRELLEDLQRQGFVCEPTNADDVLKTDLHHFNSDASDPDWGLLSESQQQLHENCVSYCAQGVRAQNRIADDALENLATLQRTRDLAQALAPLARVVETRNERDEATALASERTGERDTALATLRTLETEHGALVSAHTREKTLHGRAARTLKKLSTEHEALAKAHESEVQQHENERQRHAEAREELAQSKQSLVELNEKTDFLFYSLTESYRNLLSFETSLMARLQRHLRGLYRLLTRQRGRNSAYDDLLESAHEHFRDYDLTLPVRRRNKLDMLGEVLRYVRENPASSLRSFSWQRLRRALQVFSSNSSEDVSVWVNARFPTSTRTMRVFDPKALDPDLDILELDFLPAETPQVSIIVPVFNDYRVTMNCLQSIQQHTADVSYEVILADDCSTDLTTSIQQRVRGIVVSRTAENQRFLRNCKQAAEKARGEILLFLNNDTAVTEAWLSTLLVPFERKETAIVGPKLLFANGSLQEAGGIIWRDASGWNFGRGDHPDRPAYNYRREVDYVSGACLAIRREVWDELDGFDERFAPAYYEDADLCFAARQAGYEVVYEPESAIFHFEGVSNGTDLTAGVKQHQVTNQGVFLDKWRDELEAQHFPNAEHVIHARDRSAGKYCVLIVDHYVPHYDKDAGGRSTYQYAKLLLDLGCRVQFMGANFFAHQPYTQQLQSLGVEVLVGESVARDLGKWLSEHAAYIDEVFLHRPHVAEQFLDSLERMHPRPPISFFGHDLHYLRFAREAELKNDSRLRTESEEWRKREEAVFKRVDRVYYFSPVELEALSGVVPDDKLRHVPLYAIPVSEIPSYAPSEPHSLLFVGGYNHPPNVDAALWLIQDILPVLRESLPDAQVHLVGSNAPPSIRDLADDSVCVHGYLSDAELAALYRRVGLAIVPLQYGAGVKGKVIEAVTQGVPVLTTAVGAEGIPEAESVMWIADTAEALASTAAELLSGAQSVDERLQASQAWINQYFSYASAVSALRKDRPALSVGAPPRRGTP
ncbi:MAG: glycosyltransferase [Congregibacter sp.]